MAVDVIIGCDPGKHGAFCFMPLDPAAPITAAPMPLFKSSVDDTDINSKGIVDVFVQHLKGRQAVACVEEVFARARQAGQTTFIRGYGKLLGVLELMDIPYILVPPQTWKKDVLGKKYDHKEKAGTISWARTVFPDFNLVPPGKRVAFDGYADSLALAYYRGRQLVQADSQLIKPL